VTVTFREEALADLDEIARFISQHNPSAADQVIDCPPARGDAISSIPC
jgi:plasmid stabilization system protein ParE